MNSQKIRTKVHIQKLMLIAASESNNIAISMGFRMAGHSFAKIAERAILTEDPIILLELEFLGIISFSSEEERKIVLAKAKEIDPETYN